MRRRREAVELLERRTAPTAASRLLAALDVPRTPDEAGTRSGLEATERQAAMAELVANGQAVPLGDALVGREGFDVLATRVERGLAAAHRRSPLRAGAPREEVRSSLGLAPKRFNALVDRLSRDGRLVEHGSALALPGHVVALATAQAQARSLQRQGLTASPDQHP